MQSMTTRPVAVSLPLISSFISHSVNSIAQFEVGVLLMGGCGAEILKNLSESAFWFQIAHQADVDDATYNLAVMYLKGEGVPQDRTRALYLLNRLTGKFTWLA